MELTIMNLTKRYTRDKLGLSDYSINISSGILGLLGPNGAGKSTLIKILSTISKPTSGGILLDGINILKNPDKMRQKLGYLPQDFGVYPNLNAYEFLHYIAAMKGVGGPGLKHRIQQLLEELNLIESAQNYLGTYSGGMIQRIGIAQALLNNPDVIIFDEPTVGLDPQERLRFRDLLSDLAKDRIIILSSHIVSDIETIADEVAIMKSGQLILKADQGTILQSAKGIVHEKMISKDELRRFKENYRVVSSYRVDDKFRVRFLHDEHLEGATLLSPSLEDAYIHLTQN